MHVLQRRTDGKQSQELAEDILDIQRKKEAEKIKADKEAKDKERKRLQIELLRDKIERYQNAHGTVPHDLMEQLATLEGFRPAKTEAVATDPRAALKQALAALAGS
jgi:adenine-specific DNA methylase